jgi:hypothetical protein
MNKVSQLSQVSDSTILYTLEIALYGSSEIESQIGIITYSYNLLSYSKAFLIVLGSQ